MLSLWPDTPNHLYAPLAIYVLDLCAHGDAYVSYLSLDSLHGQGFFKH